MSGCVKVVESVSVSAVKARFKPGGAAEEPGEYDAFVLPDDPDVKSKRKVKPKPGETVPGVQFVRKPRTVNVKPDGGIDR